MVVGTDISHTISSGGGTQTWYVDTQERDALKVSVSDNQGNYDIDIRSADDQGNSPRNVSWGDLSAVLPSTVTISDTNTHEVATSDIGRITAVRITNNAGSNADFSGSISTRHVDSETPLHRFLGSSAEAYVDGNPRFDAEEILVGGTTTITTRGGDYTLNNVTTDRSLDADNDTIDNVADTLGSLISDLQSIGLID